MIKVIICDDRAIIRDGLEMLLKLEKDIDVAGQAQDGAEAVELVDKTRPDLVLMDLKMPGLNGIEATRIIKQEHPGIHVIGLSLHEDKEIAASMLAAGATAYLTKGGPSEELCRVIREAT